MLILVPFLIIGGVGASGYKAQEQTTSAIHSKKAPDFRELEINDLKESFQLSLENFKEVAPEYLEEIEKNQAVKSLQPIYWSAMNGIEKGDMMPFIFMNGNKGIILTKKADGTNTYYSFEKTGEYWEVTDSITSKGKSIKSFP